MNRRVWTLVFVLNISSLFTVRSAFPHGQTPSQRRAIDPPAKPTDSPVSLGMLVGDTLYISGRVGLDPKTGKVPDNLAASVDKFAEKVPAPGAAAPPPPPKVENPPPTVPPEKGNIAPPKVGNPPAKPAGLSDSFKGSLD